MKSNQSHSRALESSLWPVWIPLPRNPWRLSHVDGEFLRDEKGHALAFQSALSAELHARQNGFTLLVDLIDAGMIESRLTA